MSRIKEIKRLLELVQDDDRFEMIRHIEEIEKILDDIEQPKRLPLADGTLPLTESEIEEFSNMVGYRVIKVGIGSKRIWYDTKDYSVSISLSNFPAILWLAERFELGGGE